MDIDDKTLNEIIHELKRVIWESHIATTRAKKVLEKLNDAIEADDRTPE